MRFGRCASISSAWRSSSFPPSCCSTRSSRWSITACSTPSGRIRCTRSWCSISAASRISPARISFRWRGARIRRRCSPADATIRVRWDSYWHVPPCPFVMQRLERPDDTIFGTPRLVAGMVARGHRASPRLSHPSRDLHVAIPRPLEPGLAGLGLARSGVAIRQRPSFRPLVTLHDALQPTLLFRPGLLADPGDRGACVRVAAAIGRRQEPSPSP